MLLAVVFTASYAGTKRALIFAIGSYPHDNGWGEISSLKDVAYVKAMLKKQGFDDKNVKTVADAAATVKGMEDALVQMVLDAAPGDVVLIHVSSHGEQVEDDNNDETDGLDETIVSFNAVAPNRSQDFSKDQANYFRDDMFGMYINQIRANVGKDGDVIVFMDCCHSGTGTRGSAKVRGGKPPLVSKDFNPAKFATTDKGVFKEGGTARGNEDALGTYIVFSAARAEELDYEAIDDHNVGMGSLTYAISKAFENLDPGTTYRSLFARIQAIMNVKVPVQHPVMEGNGTDRTLFGGAYVQQKPYVEIEKLIDTKQLIVKAGLLAGLDAGAKVTVYSSGTSDPSKGTPLVTGSVIKADNYTATVQLDKEYKILTAAAAWVFITEPVYKTNSINLGIASTKTRGASFSDEDVKTIKGSLKDMPLIKFDGTPELMLVRGSTSDSITLPANGYVFTAIKNAAADTAKLKAELQAYAQYKFLQGLEIKDPSINVEVKLVPVIDGKAQVDSIASKMVNGVYELRKGDKVAVWVKNNSQADVYVNVLDLQPDGVINPILPYKRKNIYPRDLKIIAGGSRLFDSYVINISPPYGTEIFKIFASTSEIDMEGIATTRGQNTRGGKLTVMEKLVKTSYKVATRGGDVDNTSSADGTAFSLLFTIKP